MAHVRWHTMMSLDAFIAGPGDSMQWVFDIRGGSGKTAAEIVRSTPNLAPLARPLFLSLERAAGMNACFAVHRNQRRLSVNGHEVYVGITERSFTRWTSNGRTTNVELYRSPDAGYWLSGAIEGDIYSGIGEQRNCCGGTSPEAFFRAVRVGEPDLAKCLSD